MQQSIDDRRALVGDEVGKQRTAEGRPHALGRQCIFDRERNAEGQRTIGTLAKISLSGASGASRQLWADGDEGIEDGIEPLDPRQAGVHYLDWR